MVTFGVRMPSETRNDFHSVALVAALQLHPGDLHPSSRMLWSKRPAKNKHPAVAAKQVPKKNAAGVHGNPQLLLRYICI